MKEICYAIISYHRPECVTARTLIKLGVPESKIIIFLQDKNDLPKYDKNWTNIKKVLVEGKGVATNRNNVLRYEGYPKGCRVALLDDDVLSFIKLDLFFDEGVAKAKSRKIYDGNIFFDILDECFEETEKIGASVFGISPTGNPMFAKGRLMSDGIYSINKLFQGGLVGHIIDKQTYYDESYSSVEDYELQLRIYSNGGIVLRRNDIAASKKPNRNYAGGLFDFYRTNQQNADLDRLCSEYKNLVSVKKDYSGVIQLR